MAVSLIVEDKHFAYLKVQKGSIRYLAHNRRAWLKAYNRRIVDDYAGIHPYLPNSCGSVLDIGGGIGGIDALLVRKFGADCEICILDGERDKPVMKQHRKTFNDMRVARDFLTKNGVCRFSYYTPANLKKPRPFDLIISLGSWCFHYPAETYLKFVRSCCHAGTTLIVDVRKQKQEWSDALDQAFRLRAVLPLRPKFDRKVFAVDEHQIPRGFQSLVA